MSMTHNVWAVLSLVLHLHIICLRGGLEADSFWTGCPRGQTWQCRVVDIRIVVSMKMIMESIAITEML